MYRRNTKYRIFGVESQISTNTVLYCVAIMTHYNKTTHTTKNFERSEIYVPKKAWTCKRDLENVTVDQFAFLLLHKANGVPQETLMPTC